MNSDLTPADMIGTAMDTLACAKAYERNGFPQESCDMLRAVREMCSRAILAMGEERDRQRAKMRRYGDA